jgi:hypothetical protein
MARCAGSPGRSSQERAMPPILFQLSRPPQELLHHNITRPTLRALPPHAFTGFSLRCTPAARPVLLDSRLLDYYFALAAAVAYRCSSADLRDTLQLLIPLHVTSFTFHLRPLLCALFFTNYSF